MGGCYSYELIYVSSAVGGQPPLPPRSGFAWLAGVMVVVAGTAVAGPGWLRAAEGCGHVHIHSELWMLFNVLRAQLRLLCSGWDE